MIENLEQLRGTRVHPFPTRPKKRLGAAVRIDGVLTAVDLGGRIYSTRVSGGRAISIARMGPCSQDLMARALTRLDLLAPEVSAELTAEADAAEKRESANWMLAHAKDMEQLGVPFTASQLRRLEALAQ